MHHEMMEVEERKLNQMIEIILIDLVKKGITDLRTMVYDHVDTFICSVKEYDNDLDVFWLVRRMGKLDDVLARKITPRRIYHVIRMSSKNDLITCNNGTISLTEKGKNHELIS